jgi:hypothetical protein
LQNGVLVQGISENILEGNMGGYLSGRYRTANRGAIEHAQRIDVRRLKQLGLVCSGAYVASTLRWSRHGEEYASVGISVDLSNGAGGAMNLAYSNHGVTQNQTVQIVAQPCRYGGHRFYFRCPVTGDRVAGLALAAGHFVSRKAARLTYSSQSEDKLGRLYRTRAKAEARAFGKDHYPRPRGKNRERLVERWIAAERAADELFASEAIRRFGLNL